MAEATTRSWSRRDGILAALLERPFVRRIVRDGRYTVPVCILLICGCFAAAALLQMRLDRSHALAQAATSEQARIQMIARTTSQTLDRYARLGAVFAASPEQYRSAELGRAELFCRLLDNEVLHRYLNRAGRWTTDDGPRQNTSIP